MATERQIAANRANAQRSTGPRTAVGKMKASRNAFRHGLSNPTADPASPEIDLIAREVAGDNARDSQISFAYDFARSQVELIRIRSIRAQQLQSIDLNAATEKQLRGLAALYRYERYAHTKRRRAAKKLICGGRGT
jgi:hypothetical protein